MGPAATRMNSIDRDMIPKWAVKRACQITGCGWSDNELRAATLDDSYVYTIWKVAKHVLDTEEMPADPLIDTIEPAVMDALRAANLSGVPGWPGTVAISLAVAKAIRASDLTPAEVFGEDS